MTLQKGCLLCSFNKVTHGETECIIKMSSTCALDPFPTALLKVFVHIFKPQIVNSSLQSSLYLKLPSVALFFQEAHITPRHLV